MIYDNIESLGLPADMQTWESAKSPFFAQIIEEIKPKVIIEVGSWKGASAMVMAALGKEYGTHVHCVDTWLGDVHHRIAGNTIPRDQWGASQLYHQFLTNVKREGFSDRITPHQMTSTDGARWLAHLKITAPLIYIDGSHHMEDCYQDIKNYWLLLEDGGVLFGDDHLVFPGVFAAVLRFCCETGMKMETRDPFWILRKD